eukprot:TRINITY_DN7354_c0_g1_i3.p1 TRINITY_DN7354_c0_g1~~TRINITY_DN7354_c0_g1_i3.p1  ORF type:complete len:374 (+),score=58.25 TRINITY_DN7354_c0_g1_i3:136-1257(+)
MPCGWRNSIVKTVLMGTHDPDSPLYHLHSQQDILHHIFSFWAEVLVCLGGRTNASSPTQERLSSAEMYNWTSERWLEVSSMGSKRSAGVAVVYNNDLYVFGGYNGSNCLQTAEVFEHRSQQWRALPSMSGGRCASGAALQGKLYVVGGYSVPYPMVCESTLECYEPGTQTWTVLPAMSCKRSRVAAAVAGGELYALGGCPESEVFLSSVEKFCPDTQEWQEVEPMKYPRGYAAAAVLGDNIFVCGGFMQDVYLNAVEAFNVVTETWTEIAPMSAVRSAASAVEVQGYIYVLGGYDPKAREHGHVGCSDRLDIVERLDPVSNSWQTVTPMITPRSHAMCVKYSCLTGFRSMIQHQALGVDSNEYSFSFSDSDCY